MSLLDLDAAPRLKRRPAARPAPAAAPHAVVLKFGSSGPAVRRLQRMLNAASHGTDTPQRQEEFVYNVGGGLALLVDCFDDMTFQQHKFSL